MIQQLVQWFGDNNIFAPQDEIEIFKEHTRQAIIPKNTIIMPQGRPVEKLYFINDGMVRLMRQHTDNDTTIAFVRDNEFASTIIYLLNQVPSPCALETCTDVNVLYWEREDILHLKQHTTLAQHLETALTEILLTWMQDREIDKLSMDADERYTKLIKGMPAGLLEVPAKHIASFLGIHTDSLSRIRKRLNKRN